MLPSLLWTVVALGLGFTALGLWGYTSLMDANPCTMTYSMPQLVPVNVTSSILPPHKEGVEWVGFKLLRHIYVEDGENAPMRPNPVLFVPGHGGRYR